MTDARPSRKAFTLVEVLVVMGIISLLMSILMPALSKARAAATNVKCLANLRTIGQAMLLYASDNHDAILGSANTTGRCLWTTNAAGNFVGDIYSPTNLPPGSPIELYDWMGPAARTLAIELPDTTNGIVLLRRYRQIEAFHCPAAQGILASTYAGTIEAGQMLSYNTAAAFMLRPYDRNGSGFTGKVKANDFSTGYWVLPSGYSPKLTRIGNSAEKIFCADGAKYTTCYDPNVPSVSYADVDNNHQMNNFSDYGAFFGNSKSYCRFAANGGTSLQDARIFSYRHGTKDPYQPAGTYRLNAVFFDGHAESLDDKEASNPDLWLPKGTTLADPSANVQLTTRPFFWQDVQAWYHPGGGPYTAP